MLGGLDRPTEGKVFVDGKDIFALKDEELTIFRRRKIGFVFQAYNLVPVLNVYENIVLPIELDGGKIDRKFIDSITETLGLQQRLDALPGQLSGGQQQRVAIARALAAAPAIILADEPTGSVDTKTADIIFDIFRELNRNGQTILIVTHDIALSKKVRRVVAIRDGKISSERILKEKYADRLKELTVDWRNEDTQEEYAVIDKAGRVQIPRELWDKLALRDNKVKLELRGDEILLSRPAEDENRNM